MIKSIPLNKLVQSPRNVRRHDDPTADGELKASIAAHGLLQNLIVRPAVKGKFEVEAGERRRRAMLMLADEKIIARDHEVMCLVIEDSAEAAVETSLAENFHRLSMNPADEAQAFAALVTGGATVEEVARRFGLTVRFVEGRLRLATLAPVVFEALASGRITLDIAKAFGATSDQQIQVRVFEQVSSACYAPNPDSIRRMVLSGTVRGSDPRARLVGRDAYIAAGGRIERELFDDDDSESWSDVALLESLATAKMEEVARAHAAAQGLAWVKPTLDPYASHDLVEGLVRLPAEPSPLAEAEQARLDELDALYDGHAAILEAEDSSDEDVAAAEAAIEAIDRECREIQARPPVIALELKAEAGMILVLARDGTPVLQPAFYGERQAEPAEGDSGIEVVAGEEGSDKRRTTLSKRLVDELAMQRRDVLALHVASDPGLALDIMVFTLADADTHDWRSRAATTLRAPVPTGPILGFEAKDAPASSALAELRSNLDESWRAGTDATSRFDLFRALSDEARATWLGYVVARSLEASLNLNGERQLPFQDHLGSLIGIDMAQWWRPTAANYFDRVSKQVILDALTDVGGFELSSRFASVKKGDLAMSAERVFAGTTITEVEVREKALAWVPEVMRFAPASDAGEPEIDATDAEPGVDTEHQSPRGLAA
ncbi:ParB/RepB/Spo0J family partition protein [Sphingomonas sp. FW199]|uniref:ParB/RepB/Spo0J family partition protein n=1 Tax=Sphingomonas sp. FW199 TaxID=3400217 RepID=UPI003CF4392F